MKEEATRCGGFLRLGFREGEAGRTRKCVGPRGSEARPPRVMEGRCWARGGTGTQAARAPTGAGARPRGRDDPFPGGRARDPLCPRPPAHRDGGNGFGSRRPRPLLFHSFHEELGEEHPVAHFQLAGYHRILSQPVCAPARPLPSLHFVTTDRLVPGTPFPLLVQIAFPPRPCSGSPPPESPP